MLALNINASVDGVVNELPLSWLARSISKRPQLQDLDNGGLVEHRGGSRSRATTKMNSLSARRCIAASSSHPQG